MSSNKTSIMLNTHLTVVSVKRLSTHFIRIGFTSDKPLEVDPKWICPHLKLLFPDVKTGDILFPVYNENNKIIWQEGMRERVRTYSIRQYDTNLKQLFVDFVVHPAGVASTWALQAKIGDQIGLLTMGSKRVFNDNHLVLIGDMSALPTICYTIEQHPKNQQITAFIEVHDKSDRNNLTDYANNETNIKVNWLICSKSEPSKLINAVLQYQFTNSDNLFFAGGIEGGIAQQMRHQLKDKYQQLSTDAIQIINYWREGLAEGEFKHRD